MKNDDRSSMTTGEEFLSLVSHEIKSPLTSITGYTSFAEDAVRNNDQSLALESLQVVRSEARRILRLAEDLLDAACLRAGKFTVTMEDVDLPKIVSRVVERHAMISGRQIDLCLMAPLHSITGDGCRLTQVIENLVSNAVKYSPDDQPIRIVLDTADGKVRLSVWNGGPIIPAEKLVMLFERFSRLHYNFNGNGKHVKGTGLGLFISKQIVEMHKGSISVSSAEGQGTTFTIELPHRSESVN